MRSRLIAFAGLILLALTGWTQQVHVFEGIPLDSSYSIVAYTIPFTQGQGDSLQYSFYVHDPVELKRMKAQWVVHRIVPRFSLEGSSVNLFVIKDKQLVNTQIMIYPRQGIIRTHGTWYDFDMKKFREVQSACPLSFHSGNFQFSNDLDFELFQDSIREVPSFLFLLGPDVHYEGYFDLICSRSPDPDSPILILSDINRELGALTSPENFSAEHLLNDPFNLSHRDLVKIRVHCARSLYTRYQVKGRIKGPWVPATFDAKVIFHD